MAYFSRAVLLSNKLTSLSSRLLSVSYSQSVAPFVTKNCSALTFYSNKCFPVQSVCFARNYSNKVPSDNYRFTKSHEWVALNDDVATVGVSDHAQDSLGEAVYVELPEVDSKLSQGDVFGTVESVKAAADLYSPLSGVVSETNEGLSDEPDLINQSPYEKGWIMKLKVTSPEEYKELMTAQEYENFLNESGSE